jgi:hypothetical protein
MIFPLERIRSGPGCCDPGSEIAPTRVNTVPATKIFAVL